MPEGNVAVQPVAVEPASDAWMGEPLAAETERVLAEAGVALPPPGSRESPDYELTTTLAVGQILGIRARLTRAADSSAVLDVGFTLPPDSLGTLPGHLASLVATGFGRPLHVAAQHAPTPAFLTYLRARSYLRGADSADVRWAAELFRQVIAADSGFAPAWRGLAEALGAMAVAEGRPSPGQEADEWREAMRRTVALDSVAAAGRTPDVSAGASPER